MTYYYYPSYTYPQTYYYNPSYTFPQVYYYYPRQPYQPTYSYKSYTPSYSYDSSNTPEDNSDLIIALLIAGLLLIGAVACIIYGLTGDKKADSFNEEMDRELKQAALLDARLTTQYRQQQLEHLDHFRRENGL